MRGDISLKTANGRIEIGIRPGTAARLDVHTRSAGSATPSTRPTAPDRSDEVATVSARTSFGDIVIRRPESHTTP